MDVRRLAREERADFAAFLATLSPQQWQAPTLCAAWRVQDVVAHVISYDDLGARGISRDSSVTTWWIGSYMLAGNGGTGGSAATSPAPMSPAKR